MKIESRTVPHTANFIRKVFVEQQIESQFPHWYRFPSENTPNKGIPQNPD